MRSIVTIVQITADTPRRSISRFVRNSATLWDNRTMPERKRRPRDPNDLRTGGD
jgi:hypothetical protein